MDDNNGIPTANGFPNPNPVQPVNPVPGQPVGQPFNQPTYGAPTTQTMPAPQATPAEATGSNTPGSKKKLGLIIGCVIGAVAIIAIAAVVLINIMGHSEKMVACTTDTTTMGINVKRYVNINVKDGKITDGDITVSVDLKTMQDSYKKYEKDIVDRITENYKSHCEDHCTFSYDYSEGDSASYTMRYDEDGVVQIVRSYGTEKMSTQEIADKVQKALEDSDTTCVQH
ncbi:hypothetical protein J6X73_00140 [Candidatus Saccharibacteria bacterium]|nr:hypothetical protein [Candidatus Saccharibacteria bacterium]